MSGNANRRLWSEASVSGDAGHWQVMLDGRPLRVPGGGVIDLPTTALAEAVAAEWRAAGDGRIGGSFAPNAVPLTQLCNTMLARVRPHRDRAVAMLLKHGESDLLCYPADHPASLVSRQRAEWLPWLDWCRERFGASLLVGPGVMPVQQPPDAIDALREALTRRTDAELTGLGLAVPVLGSLALGLALAEGALDAAEAARIATLDEQVQAEEWGEDAEAAARLRALGAEIALAERFIRLAGART
ncbi:ATP12 family protein [Rhizosaccharibacter radicis]|uniref:ATP12 family chaperone protein n=1 Tax=Rhizosaccharibacter radicis TaxID=2782605 RepID=A0ABT1VZ16_9PROT|nr:ATP12 family chaperone protein [Acetobacteraceae bacterium KSS12]